MIRKVVTVLALVFAAAAASPALAQTAAGQQELSFLASFADLPGSESDGTLSLTGRYSRFLTDALSVGGGLLVAGEIDDLDDFIFAEVFATYHFNPAEVNTWYVRGGFLALVSEPGDGFLEAAGGYKSYFNENTAVFAEAVVGTSIGDIDGTSSRLVAGLTYVF